ncbi:hypothetical protein [Bradyrhizobium sp. LB14.3]|uniref:hypothetical protein n=1 Tax=Bradyrhizobium sp. LB14.3 TaxID=3156328 RepID=UPI003396DEC9
MKAVAELGEALRADVADSIAKMDAKHTALADSVAKLAAKKSDQDDDTAAERTAADSVSRGEFRALQDRVNDVTVKQLDRGPADRDALAELQARADVSYRCLGEGSAPAPMQGETVLDYACRIHRPLQKHSKRFAKSELAVIARDQSTFQTVLDGIRADAYEAGLKPVDMQPYVFREVKTESPGGHRITSFVGSKGTFAGAMSRPVRKVIGFYNEPRLGRPGVPNSSGGSIN